MEKDLDHILDTKKSHIKNLRKIYSILLDLW